MRLIDSIAEWLVAVLDSATAHIRESTAAMEDREYWRGYTDGIADERGTTL